MDSRKVTLAIWRVLSVPATLHGMLSIVGSGLSLAPRPWPLGVAVAVSCVNAAWGVVALWTYFSKLAGSGGYGIPTLFLVELMSNATLRHCASIDSCVLQRVRLWTLAKCMGMYLRRWPLSGSSWPRLLRLQLGLVLGALLLVAGEALDTTLDPLVFLLNELFWLYLLVLWTMLLLPKAVHHAMLCDLRRQCSEHMAHPAGTGMQEALYWRSVLVRQRVLYDMVVMEARAQCFSMLMFTVSTFLGGVQSACALVFSYMQETVPEEVRPTKTQLVEMVVFFTVCHTCCACAAELKGLPRHLEKYLLQGTGARHSDLVKKEIIRAIVTIDLQDFRNDVGGFLYPDVELMKRVVSGVVSYMFLYQTVMVNGVPVVKEDA